MMELAESLRKHEYELIKKLGAGGMGNVYLVLSTKYNQHFAAKQIKMKSEDDENEIRTLMSLNHPNVIKMYEIFSEGSFNYIILEYCENGSLKDLIDKKERIHHAQLFSYIKQLAAAVDFCHSFNIAHRDIKPANLLLDGYGKLKLADFGLSRNLSEKEILDLAKNNYYMNLGVCGSPSYMAPELLNCPSSVAVTVKDQKMPNSDSNDVLLTNSGNNNNNNNSQILTTKSENDITTTANEVKNENQKVVINSNNLLTNNKKVPKYDAFKADVWAMGVTIYELASGKKPFVGTLDELKKIVKHGFEKPPEINDLLLSKLLRGMMKVSPNVRYTIKDVLKSQYFERNNRILDEESTSLGGTERKNITAQMMQQMSSRADPKNGSSACLTRSLQNINGSLKKTSLIAVPTSIEIKMHKFKKARAVKCLTFI